ncbi:MAG: AMP-binding protein, partial [Phycisphaeraceae bacterium]|nr:AMP-binding protein [Phycisphaeraceae bacterium]
MSLIWSILKTALRQPNRVIMEDDRRTYTYSQLVGGAMFVADHLDSRTKSPHVGLMLPTCGAFPMALMGAWLAGRTAVPLNYLLHPNELKLVIADAGLDAILTTQVMIDFIGKDNLPHDVQLLRVEDIDYSGAPPWRWPSHHDPDDLATLIYTSGTSGTPKGVMLTHGNLESNVEDCVQHVRLNAADTFLGVLPQFHCFGFTALTLLPLRVGAKIVYSARFVPKKIVELIRRHRPDVFMGVPSMYAALLSVKDAGPDDFQSVRIPVSGGEPLPRSIYDQCLARFGIHLLEGYGLTETSPVANWMPPHLPPHPGSVGPAMPHVRILLVDDQLKPVGPTTDGEILLAGPNVMKGYYQRRQLDAQVFVHVVDPDTGRLTRFFRTGDIGRFDADGCLYIT